MLYILAINNKNWQSLGLRNKTGSHKPFAAVKRPASINIRAYDPKLTYSKEGEYLGTYYNLNFEVKDGKVKVDAPLVDENLTRSKDGVRDRDFSKLVRSWFQEATLQAKYQDNASYTESEFNGIINGILTGNFMGDSSDNW